jgi:uncharacterized protein (DUF488 family)
MAKSPKGNGRTGFGSEIIHVMAGKRISSLAASSGIQDVSVRICTIGHSTRSIGEFVDLLRAEGVTLLADVRRFPRSRRHPQFNIETLSVSLAGSGIGYRHFEALGGRRKSTLTDDASPNTGWEADGFRSYADYAMTAPFRDALNALVGLAQSQMPAIMCAEALWWQCHRRIIGDYLLIAGMGVVHILGSYGSKPAVLTPGAEPQADGTIHYPPPQPRLL